MNTLPNFGGVAQTSTGSPPCAVPGWFPAPRPLLFDAIMLLTCHCGRQAWIQKLPFRCHDCAETWVTPEQIDADRGIIVKATLTPLKGEHTEKGECGHSMDMQRIQLPVCKQ